VADLQLTDHDRWRQLRRELEARHATRRAHCRFRRDPVSYLNALEAQLLQPGFPP
jgi:hypothetical protein